MTPNAGRSRISRLHYFSPTQAPMPRNLNVTARINDTRPPGTPSLGRTV
jgi:hypothetical protein